MKTRSRMMTLFVAVVMVGLMISGCGGKTNDTTEGKNKIAFVTSAAGQNDTGYNKMGIEALTKVASEIKAEYKVVEPKNGVPAALETLADDGYRLIFSLEYDFEALINGVGGEKPLAEKYPDTVFVIFNANPNVKEDGTPKYDNVISVLFNVNEGAYLAGYGYVLVNENQKQLFGEGYQLTDLEKTRAAGFVGGTNSEGILVFSYGFVQGMQQAAAELGVNYEYYAKYDAGFVDPATGSTIAGTYYDNGANAVFAVAGMVGDGITAKAKEAGKLAIQVDGDLDSSQPGYVLTSVLKNTGVPVTTISKALAEGKMKEMDNAQTYDMASGATGITDMSVIGQNMQDQKVWTEIKEKIEAAQKQIEDGTIKVVNAQAGDAFDPATVPNINIK